MIKGFVTNTFDKYIFVKINDNQIITFDNVESEFKIKSGDIVEVEYTSNKVLFKKTGEFKTDKTGLKLPCNERIKR